MKKNSRLHPDSPCLGFCTTALGDDVCKSCGRTFEEVTFWISMTEDQKKSVWDRLNKDGYWEHQRIKLQGKPIKSGYENA